MYALFMRADTHPTVYTAQHNQNTNNFPRVCNVNIVMLWNGHKNVVLKGGVSGKGNKSLVGNMFATLIL